MLISKKVATQFKAISHKCLKRKEEHQLTEYEQGQLDIITMIQSDESSQLLRSVLDEIEQKLVSLGKKGKLSPLGKELVHLVRAIHRIL